MGAEPGKKERRDREREGEERERERERMASASSSSSGLTFKVHPLVIVNISDHYTRVKSQQQQQQQQQQNTAADEDSSSSVSVVTKSPRVYGCVIGVQRGRTVEIFNSFELLYDPSTHSLDRTFLDKKQDLCNCFLFFSFLFFYSLLFSSLLFSYVGFSSEFW